MSGRCVEKLPHAKCGSSDALQVFEDGGKYTGWCFKCQTYDPDPYGGNPPEKIPPKLGKSAEQVAEELNEIGELLTVDLPDRHLRKETLEYFGIKVAVSEEDGKTPTAHFYPYCKEGKLTGYKGRVIETKQFFAVGNVKDADFFGWEQAIASGAKRLIITEGELDAPSVFQALKDKDKNTAWAGRNPAVVSLVHGSGSAGKALSSKATEIRAHFQEVILAFDQDEAGKAAVAAAMLSYPSAISAALPGKDPNECLKEGRSLALANAVLFRAAKPKNSRLVWAESLYEAAKEPAKWGLTTPWPSLTEMMRGFRTGETIYIGAGVKMGKSTVVDAIATHMMVDHGLRVMLAKPEEGNKKTVKKILGYAAGSIFTDPKVEFDEAAYERAREIVKNQFCMINLYQHLTWSDLKQDIKAAVDEGCKAIFIDPITNLTNGIPSGEANTVLQSISQEYSAMSMDMDFIGFMFCHLLAPESGPPHERGGPVLSRQFAGSRAMSRSCNYMLGLEGDKNPDLPIEQRNMRSLVLLEDREFGEVGRVPLYYDFKNGLLKEVPQ